MKKLIFWASALLLAGAVASCEPQTPKEPENPSQPESPVQPENPNQPEDSADSNTPSQPVDRPFANFTAIVKGVAFDMVAVEGGSFQMGATMEQGRDADSDEKPVHTVNLSNYYMAKTEVTQALYQAVMGNNPSRFKGDNLPVECVYWTEAQDFCKKLSQLTGEKYVLPTEAQWEYAARGGKQQENTKYAGSSYADDVAWLEVNSNGQTHTVATKTSNALGLYDMSGNVWEWCADWYDKYSSEEQTNPTGPADRQADGRVIRGGGWRDDYDAVRVSVRVGYTNSRNSDCGFRIALIP